MKTIVTFKFPDADFWESYIALWNNSRIRSVFQAPHYLQFLAAQYSENLVVYQYYIDNELSGAAFFRKEGRIHRLLSDIKSDHNFFILHKNCTEQDVFYFFESLFGLIQEKDWAFILRNQPKWADYWTVFTTAGQSCSALYYSVEAYSKCLVVEKECPEAIAGVLSKSKNIKSQINRLKREHGLEYEVFTTNEHLEAWTEGFCKTHTKRWQNAGTPSRYRKPEAVKFLYGCLKAWQEDGVLVRFAIKAGAERIAYGICLLQNDVLICHSLAFDPDYQIYSPGKILMSVIGGWMNTRNLSKLDFGEGTEDYKYAYSNTECELKRVFVSRRLNLSFILLSEYRQFYRKQAKKYAWLKKWYYNKILRAVKATKIAINAKICFTESFLDTYLDFYLIQLGL